MRCACAGLCVWWGGGGGMGVDKFIQNQADVVGEGGEILANVAPIVDKLFKKSSRF